MISIEKLKKRNELGKVIQTLKRMICEAKSREMLVALSEITKEYDRLMFEIYSIDNMIEAFELLGDSDHVVTGDILIKRTKDFIMFKDLTDSEVIKKFTKNTYDLDNLGPVTDSKSDTRSDDEIVSDFIAENNSNGIECTKKYILSMLTGTMSKLRVNDALTRLVMVGLNGKKLILVENEDLTMKDKVYKII